MLGTSPLISIYIKKDLFTVKAEEMSLLSVNNSLFQQTDSIWTFNCPCPTRPEQHKRHVCRFKSVPATATEEGLLFTLNLKKQYNVLNDFFYAQRRREPTRIETAQPIETTMIEFHRFLHANKLMWILRERQCFKGSLCHNSFCEFAHSLGDMLAVFRDERVRRFYKETVYITDSTYKPHTTIMEVNTPDKFTHCGDSDVIAKLVYHRSAGTLLLYPYIVIQCNHCQRVTNTAVYC